MAEYLTPLAIMLLIILVNGFFVAAEFALLAASKPRMERLASLGSRAAAVIHTYQDNQTSKDRYVATAQLGVSASSLGLGMYGEQVLAGWIHPLFAGAGWLQGAASHTVAAMAAVLALTYLHVVLGEMVPKSVTLSQPDRAALGLGLPMLWVERLLFPVVLALNAAAIGMVRLLGIPAENAAAQVHSPKELAMIVEESHETGVLGQEESDILVNLLHFSNMQVRKVMVPRTHVVGIPAETSVDEAVRIAVAARHTRYPVYDGSLDSITGILHVKELFKEIRRHPDGARLARALRRPVFVPEQMTLEDLLREFGRNRSQVAVVMDEYGGTSGMVSLEDVLEEIFGEVQDEFDHEEPDIRQIGERRYVVLGRARLDEFCDTFDVKLERPDVDTVGGLVLAALGRPARVGDSVEIEGLTFIVTALDGLAVGRVTCQLPEPGVDEESCLEED